MTLYHLYAVGDRDGGQVPATREGVLFDAGDRIWNKDGGHTGLPREGSQADDGHSAGNNCILASCNESVVVGHDNGVAIVSAVIDPISCIHRYGCQASATTEGFSADDGHRVWDGDGCQAAAMIEGVVADAGHRVGDGDGG